MKANIFASVRPYPLAGRGNFSRGLLLNASHRNVDQLFLSFPLRELIVLYIYLKMTTRYL